MGSKLPRLTNPSQKAGQLCNAVVLLFFVGSVLAPHGLPQRSEGTRRESSAKRNSILLYLSENGNIKNRDKFNDKG